MAGMNSNPAIADLFDMFLAERVPPTVSEEFVRRYVVEETLARSVFGKLPPWPAVGTPAKSYRGRQP